MSEAEARHTVHLLGLPVSAGRAVVLYRDDMIRELQLIELGRNLTDVSPSALDPVAHGLRRDLEWLRDDFTDHSRSVLADTHGAAPDGGDEIIDYSADLLPDAATRMKRVVDQFDELNWFASQGHLLTVAASPVVMSTVRWMCQEVVGQMREGRAPRPFPSPVG